MAFEKYDPNDPNALDADALLKQLGAAPPGVSTSMPVADPTLQRGATSDMPTGSPAPLTGATSPGAPAVAGTKVPINAAAYTGFDPKQKYGGFDFQREQNPGKSAKDAFAMLSNQAPPAPLHDKAALGAWFKQYIEPGMNELGHTIQSVDGDKMRFKNWQGDFNVDYGVGAGAEGGNLGWQAEDANGPQTAGVYTPQQAPAVPQPTSDTGPSALDQILAEVQALQGGGQSPMDANALMQLLQGTQG